MWISIKDKSPEVGDTILTNKVHVLMSDGKQVRAGYYEKPLFTKRKLPCRFIEYDGRLSFLIVTHWQQIPEPPKEE